MPTDGWLDEEQPSLPCPARQVLNLVSHFGRYAGCLAPISFGTLGAHTSEKGGHSVSLSFFRHFFSASLGREANQMGGLKDQSSWHTLTPPE